MKQSIVWLGDRVQFIDQSQLPSREYTITTDDPAVVADAICSLSLRGAPLIGIAAAYAVALSALRTAGNDLPHFRLQTSEAMGVLGKTRPTAVNLFWSLRRMTAVLHGPAKSVRELCDALVKEAVEIHREDKEMCRRIGEHGAVLIQDGSTILTHCNTGALATGGEGTAQAVISTAHRQGKRLQVFADETRPVFQGARLTAWELQNLGIDVTVITDGTAATVMKRKKVDMVIVGADRIAANGDVANKIGTYSLALVARAHGVPMYVAAPSSTIDLTIGTGDAMPIEERAREEVASVYGHSIIPEGVRVFAPAFDVTPEHLVTAIITERGIHRPPYNFTASYDGNTP